MPLEQIEIERETIGHALKDKLLYVPINQRSYAWEKEHVTDLYQDFARAIAEGDAEYFLGSIVVVRSGAGRLEVNDGNWVDEKASPICCVREARTAASGHIMW